MAQEIWRKNFEISKMPMGISVSAVASILELQKIINNLKRP